MDFFPELDVGAMEAEAIARGLYAVAMVDGVHERELALISDFYSWAEADKAYSTALIERVGAMSPQEVAGMLRGTALRELFVKTAYLLAWSDGKISPGERTKIAEYAKALDVSSESQVKLEAQVKDFLLRSLAGLSNVEAVSAVAKKMGM